jgi:hypothetical protein
MRRRSKSRELLRALRPSVIIEVIRAGVPWLSTKIGAAGMPEIAGIIVTVVIAIFWIATHYFGWVITCVMFFVSLLLMVVVATYSFQRTKKTS